MSDSPSLPHLPYPPPTYNDVVHVVIRLSKAHEMKLHPTLQGGQEGGGGGSWIMLYISHISLNKWIVVSCCRSILSRIVGWHLTQGKI